MDKPYNQGEKLFRYIFIFFILLLFSIIFLPKNSPVTLAVEDATVEGGIVENGTAIFCLLGAYFCFKIFFLRKKLLNRFDRLFLLGAILFIVVGGEEISWGQRIVGLRPIFDATEINDQRELTFHNLIYLQRIVYLGGFSLIVLAGGILPLLTYFSKSVKNLYIKFGTPLMPRIICAAMWLGFIYVIFILQIEYDVDNRRNMFDELIELYFSFTLFCYILVDYFYLLKYKRPYDFRFPKQS